MEDGLGLGNKMSVSGFANFTLMSGWPYTTGAKVRASCVIVGGVLYVGSDDGYFYAINATTGALVGRYNVGAKIRSTAHVIGGVAYFGADDGYLYAITVASMTPGGTAGLLWRSAVQAGGGVVGLCEVRTHPVVSGTKVYYGANDNKIYAANISDGSLASGWPYVTGLDDPVSGPLGAPISGALAVYDSKVYAHCANGLAYSLSFAGVPQQVFSTRGVEPDDLDPILNRGVTLSPPDGDGVTHLILPSSDHHYYDFDADTGERIWLLHRSGDCYAPAAINVDTMLVALTDHNWSIQVHHLALGDGEFWKRDGTASGAPVAGLSMANGLVFGVWPPDDGRLVAFIEDNNEAGTDFEQGGQTAGWKFGTSSGVQGPDNPLNKGWYSTPALVNGKVYWAAENGLIYAFS